MSYKIKQIIKSEITKLRFKAEQKTREAKKLNAEADELEKKLEKLEE